MLKQVLSLSLLLAAVPLACAADSNDVCSLRPDLCDDSPSVAKSAPPVKSKTACRPLGAYTAAQANLPVCPNAKPLGQATSRAAGQKSDGLSDDPVIRSGSRAPANAKAAAQSSRGISFEEYLKLNALNPAMNTKIADHQNAFVDHVVTLSYSVPSDGVSTAVDSGAASGAGGTTTMQTPAGTMSVPVPSSGGNGNNGNTNGTSDGFSSPPGS